MTATILRLPLRAPTVAGTGLEARRSLALTLVVSGMVVAAFDQLSKGLIRGAMSLCADADAACDRAALVGPLSVLRTENAGSALGLSDGSSVLPLVALALALGVLQLILARPTRWIYAAVGMQLGGLVGNLWDRVAFGGVTDFIYWQPEPGTYGVVFNVADVGLAIGGVIASVLIYRAAAVPVRARSDLG